MSFFTGREMYNMSAYIVQVKAIFKSYEMKNNRNRLEPCGLKYLLNITSGDIREIVVEIRCDRGRKTHHVGHILSCVTAEILLAYHFVKLL